jgi:hypothetical protein
MRERAQQAERLFECADIREQIDLHGQRTLVPVKGGDEQIDCGARQTDLAKVGCDACKFRPLASHRRAQRYHLPQPVDDLRTIPSAERALELVDQPKRGNLAIRFDALAGG